MATEKETTNSFTINYDVFNESDIFLTNKLPFRLLIIGDFAFSSQISWSYQPEDLIFRIDINKTDVNKLDQLMQSFDLQLVMTLANHFPYLSENKIDDFKIRLESITDFHPDQLLFKIDILHRAYQVSQELQSLRHNQGLNKNANETKTQPKHNLQTDSLKVLRYFDTTERDKNKLAVIIARIEEDIKQQLDAILHHDDFQKLESAWLGLYGLVRNLQQITRLPDTHRELLLDILPLAQAYLYEDFLHTDSIEDSLLYEIIYLNELGQYGGIPYTLLATIYTFADDNLPLLEYLNQVAVQSCAPLIASISPQFFAINNFSQLYNLSGFYPLGNEKNAYNWQSFCQRQDARFLYLLAPAIKLRPLHHYKTGSPIYSEYIEGKLNQESNGIWGNIIFPYLWLIAKGLLHYGNCISSLGYEQGSIDEYMALLHTNKTETNTGITDIHTDLDTDIRIDVCFSPNKIKQLAALGINAMSYDLDKKHYYFSSADSIHYPCIQNKDLDPGQKLGAQLPYILLICRIICHLKIIERYNVGAHYSIEDIKIQMLDWLKQFVSTTDNPSLNLLKRKPLKSVKIDVEEKEGHYKLNLMVVPHTKYADKEYALTMHTSLGK